MTDVRIHEVCLRDGLQNEPVVVPTARKLAWVERLVEEVQDATKFSAIKAQRI